jgi:acyl carrier protein
MNLAQSHREIFGKIVDITCERLLTEKPEVTPEANFSKDLAADEYDVFEILSDVENEFNIEFGIEEIEGFVLISEVTNSVYHKLAQA